MIYMNHYDILGIEKNSTSLEIKSKNRELALKLHPDKNTVNITEQFKLINLAYEILIDNTKRADYDYSRQQEQARQQEQEENTYNQNDNWNEFFDSMGNEW